MISLECVHCRRPIYKIKDLDHASGAAFTESDIRTIQVRDNFSWTLIPSHKNCSSKRASETEFKESIDEISNPHVKRQPFGLFDMYPNNGNILDTLQKGSDR